MDDNLFGGISELPNAVILRIHKDGTDRTLTWYGLILFFTFYARPI